MSTLWYPENGERRLEHMSAVAIEHEIQSEVSQAKKRGRSRKSEDNVSNQQMAEGRKEDKKMSETKRVQKTVFDLKSFDSVTLYKDVVMPEQFTELDQALNALGGKENLLKLVHAGMMEETAEKAKKINEGFCYLTDEGELGEEYKGNFADEDKLKLINAVVLNLAKMQPTWSKELDADKKNVLKEQARQFLRDNPAMLGSIQG